MEGTKKKIRRIRDELDELESRRKKLRKMLNEENYKLKHPVIDLILPHFIDSMDLSMIFLEYIDFKFCAKHQFLHRSHCYTCRFSEVEDNDEEFFCSKTVGRLKLNEATSNLFERIVYPVEDEDRFVLEDFINYINGEPADFICTILFDSPIWQKDEEGNFYLPPGMTLKFIYEDANIIVC